MKTNKFSLVLLSLLLSSSLACGLLTKAVNNAVNNAVSNATGGDSNMNAVGTLWSDVPQMDGLDASQMDMPLPIKLVMRTIIGNLGKLNGPGEDQTTGNIDWIAFTTDKTADDIQAYYTNERMTASGWDASDQSTCFKGSDQGVTEVGLVCAFTKHENGVETDLAILSAPDQQQSTKTDVFFLRLETTPTPVPSP